MFHGLNGPSVHAGDEHCILLHGFTGEPNELAPLAETLRLGGFQVISPRLAGHTGKFSGLLGVRCEDWVTSAAEPTREALTKGPVHLIGFSMGALIATVLAAELPVSSVTLLSPAIYYGRPKLVLRQALLTLRGRLYADSSERAYLSRRPSGFLMTPPSSIRELNRLVKQAKQVSTRSKHLFASFKGGETKS